MTVWPVVVLVATGCGRIAFDPRSDAAVIREDATVDVPGTPASVTLAVIQQPWGVVDLTARGTVDWVQWGWGDVTAVHRKNNATPQIAGWVELPGPGQVISSIVTTTNAFAWTDGTPTMVANPSDQFVHVDTNAPSGDGVEVLVQLTSANQRFTIYTGTWCIRARFEIFFVGSNEDNPFVNTAWDNPVAAGEFGRIELDVLDAAGLTLGVRLIVGTNYCTTGDLGEVWLGAATLADQ